MKFTSQKPVVYSRVHQGDLRYINQLLNYLDAKKDNHAIPVQFDPAPGQHRPFQVGLSRHDLRQALVEAQAKLPVQKKSQRPVQPRTPALANRAKAWLNRTLQPGTLKPSLMRPSLLRPVWLKLLEQMPYKKY